MKKNKIKKGIEKRAILRVPYAIIYIARDKDIKKIENFNSILNAYFLSCKTKRWYNGLRMFRGHVSILCYYYYHGSDHDYFMVLCTQV